jgi:hypothetical protein
VRQRVLEPAQCLSGVTREKVPDFRGHLLGRVAWVKAVQPERGARLDAMLMRVAFPVSG